MTSYAATGELNFSFRALKLEFLIFGLVRYNWQHDWENPNESIKTVFKVWVIRERNGESWSFRCWYKFKVRITIEQYRINQIEHCSKFTLWEKTVKFKVSDVGNSSRFELYKRYPHSTQSKPYCTNRREEEGLTWPFASSPAVYNEGVDTVRENIFYRNFHAVYITIDGCHYVWQKAQTAILHYTT